MFDLRPQIRIALLDDHAIVRFGMASRLSSEPDFIVVGSFENSRTMIAALRDAPADVLLIDYALGPTEIDGVSLIRALNSRFPKSSILVLSSHYDPATVALALRVGARGFVGKSQDVALIVKAIRTVASGSVFLDADMSYRLAEISVAATVETKVESPSGEAKLLTGAKLSVKEREVIRCFLDGLTVSDIAQKFGRSAKTISTQKSMAFRKLGVTSDNELFKLKHMLEEL
ncbi:response regulator transcription factor [Pseudomonas fluorescens]|uniref:Two component transcriptional regulator, LuxR family n=2 Tax=Pseudomonas fluorescens TaxID=294 RepID=A0ABY1TC52_PSEFL|nr:response regulator transcription factor [Pseudomonas fluorescens]MCI4604583.1 response regulator transcription factor [Pseudomonas fluorescens]PQB01101.1 DNA-binding response regulator [Pseudomonas fluorescens]RFP92942.1 DNA-binding response regulator [Pseudomonas fluorescens]SNY09992.1 two component transcriptional regulator, LuxR family [Pseudomonas fluorescens]SQF89493.1 LuxR family DNA-binding response regulator [Pseudomonas fluorescens]